MLSQIFIVLVLTIAVFLLGASVGQLLLRIRLEKLAHRNMQLDEERLSILQALGSKAIIVERVGEAGILRHERFENDVRNEINEIIDGLDR